MEEQLALVLSSHAPGPRSHESAGPELGHLKPGTERGFQRSDLKSQLSRKSPYARAGVLFSPASHVAQVTSHQPPVSEVQAEIMLSVFTGLGGIESSQVC